MYVLNEFSIAECSCKRKHFWKNLLRSLYFTSLRFFWHLYGQIGQLFEAQWVFEKCLKIVKSQFSRENVVNFKFFLKFKGAKRSVKMWATNFNSIRDFSEILCCTGTVGCQKFVQYIRNYVSYTPDGLFWLNL